MFENYYKVFYDMKHVDITRDNFQYKKIGQPWIIKLVNKGFAHTT